jgi:hypothetical protein
LENTGWRAGAAAVTRAFTPPEPTRAAWVHELVRSHARARACACVRLRGSKAQSYAQTPWLFRIMGLMLSQAVGPEPRAYRPEPRANIQHPTSNIQQRAAMLTPNGGCSTVDFHSAVQKPSLFGGSDKCVFRE